MVELFSICCCVGIVVFLVVDFAGSIRFVDFRESIFRCVCFGGLLLSEFSERVFVCV